MVYLLKALVTDKRSNMSGERRPLQLLISTCRVAYTDVEARGS